jgi:hypothetical protein
VDPLFHEEADAVQALLSMPRAWAPHIPAD